MVSDSIEKDKNVKSFTTTLSVGDAKQSCISIYFLVVTFISLAISFNQRFTENKLLKTLHKSISKQTSKGYSRVQNDLCLFLLRKICLFL